MPSTTLTGWWNMFRRACRHRLGLTVGGASSSSRKEYFGQVPRHPAFRRPDHRVLEPGDETPLARPRTPCPPVAVGVATQGLVGLPGKAGASLRRGHSSLLHPRVVAMGGNGLRNAFCSRGTRWRWGAPDWCRRWVIVHTAVAEQALTEKIDLQVPRTGSWAPAPRNSTRTRGPRSREEQLLPVRGAEEGGNASIQPLIMP